MPELDVFIRQQEGAFDVAAASERLQVSEQVFTARYLCKQIVQLGYTNVLCTSAHYVLIQVCTCTHLATLIIDLWVICVGIISFRSMCSFKFCAFRSAYSLSSHKLHALNSDVSIRIDGRTLIRVICAERS